MDNQIQQYVTGSFCTSHPLIHTLYLGFFHNLMPTPNEGYAIATILQIILVDSAITYALTYVYKRNHNNLLYVIIILFYGIFPITPLLAISHTKDVPFAAFGLIFFIDTLRLTTSNLGYNKYITYIRMIVNAIFMVLFRNNAIYAFSAYIVLLSIILIHRCIKKRSSTVLTRMLLISFVSMIISITCSKALFTSTSSTKGSIKEMMSLPAQVMGYIYNTSATDSEKETILAYIPNPEEYKYYISDPMKRDLPFEIWESSCKHFLLDSTIIALHHPLDAIKAVLLNIQGYFDPLHCPYSSDHFYLARHDYRGDAVQESRLPALCNFYVDALYDTESFANTPLVIPFNIAFYVWIIIIGYIISLRKTRDCNERITYLFPILYLCTLLLGPAAIIRYAFIYILIAPIVLFLSGKNQY